MSPDDDTQVTFSCSGKQGALLYLPFPAEQEDTVAFGDFGKWIVKNIHDCMRLADERGLGVNRMEDIIIVTGRHLAKSWVRAVFSENRGGGQVSFVVNSFGDSVLRLEERNVSGAQLKFGPNGGALLENQCIFVRGYRVVRRLNTWPKLRGLAGPSHLHEPEPEPDTNLELMGVPDDTDHQDPLYTLLEYIAEQSPSCDMVLVHDDDLKCIKNAVPPVETLQPDELMGFLRDYEWTIRQFRCELSTGNDNGTKAEGAVATVAALYQNAFEAPHNEGISHSNSTSNATSSGYETSTKEMERPDDFLLATMFDRCLASDDVKNKVQMQAHTEKKSPLYPAPDDETSGWSGQWPSSVEVPKMGPTPGLPSLKPHLRGIQGSSLSKVLPCFPIQTTRNHPFPNPHPPGYRGMICHLNDLAYTKVICHALKYPDKTVNGLLLGHRPAPDAPIEIVDAVPLQHHWTNLGPMMEVGLGMTVDYAQTRQLQVVGFYEAPERVGDTTLSRVGESVVAKIKQTVFQAPVALVLDGSKLGEESRAALVSYISGPASTTHCIRVEDKLRFDWSTSTRALHLIRYSNILDNFWDFDNYLEDNRAPFLTNGAVEAVLNGQRSR